ncbi:hypothetical protein SDC9_207842 [bioreactor metagenome]|uniref:Uncharacterized protein n=1 Tax=bioreactor metagenome TaxID=1076179 RepID=A0A645J9N8_9ZZZZ
MAQVNLIVSHVQVAAVDDRLFLIQAREVGAHLIFKSHAVIQPFQLGLGVWHIAVDQIKRRVLKRKHPPFVGMRAVHALKHRQRLMFGKDGCASVALFLGAVIIAEIAFRLKIRLPLLHLGFLQTEKIGVRLLEIILKPLLQHRAETVHIP